MLSVNLFSKRLAGLGTHLPLNLPHCVVSDLEAATRNCVGCYNHLRYHKALMGVTPADALEGLRDAILACRKELQRETFVRRRQYNEQVRDAPSRKAPLP